MSDKFNKKIEKTLETIKSEGKFKELRHLLSPMSGTAKIEGRDDVVILCSNNYLGLANNPSVTDAGIAALKTYGAGAASVRFICGTFDIHRTLEEKVAEFTGTEAAVTYTSCWNANTAVIPAILESGDTVISDELNHASIIDGCKLLPRDVTKLVYKHANLASLEEKLLEAHHEDEGRNVLIVTDGVFSMEGDIAPLPGIIKLARKYNAVVLVDDSHAAGVIGICGKGTAEYYDMRGQVDIVTGTFGKALGGAGGGFVAGRKSLVELCIQRSRPHLFSNSLPPVLAAIALAAIEELQANPQMVQSLQAKVQYFRRKLKEAGLNPLEGDSAIIPIMVGDTARAIAVSSAMLNKGVYAIGFGYPVVPEGTARIRIQVSDALSYKDIDFSTDVIKDTLLRNI